MKRILIFDDEIRAATKWKRDLEKLDVVSESYEVETIDIYDLHVALVELEARRLDIRKGKSVELVSGNNLFDDCAMVIVDFDLLHHSSASAEYLTGENVAYLARCFSTCGVIIALNQYGDNDFDLTLKGHPESFADVNVGGRQITSPGLWTEGWQGFRPWGWPLLPKMEHAFNLRVADILDNLDAPIFGYLGFPEECVPILSRGISEFIDVGKKSHGIERITFREFATRSKNGYKGKDTLLDSPKYKIPDPLLARVAVARISKWLERLILQGQDLLADAPHLVYRYPSLLEGEIDDLTNWNRTASLENPTIHREPIARHKFEKEHWLSRPAWWFFRLRIDRAISEVSSPFNTERPGYLFCEDISRFLPEDETQEFVADLDSPFTRRSVVDPRTCRDPKLASELKKIDYRPEVRFSL